MAQVIIDVHGLAIDAEERELLDHPNVAGVILFGRNYEEPAQLRALIQSLRAASEAPILIGVDHEGGRVQRFRDGFSRLPAPGSLRKLARNLAEAEQWAEQMGWLMAIELRVEGIDISFAPVVDLDRISDVIGDRSFSDEPEQVARLAGAYARGMRRAGMKTTLKHFPGHGSVKADSHVACPLDERPPLDIMSLDLQPFAQLIEQGLADAVMPSHVVYSQCDPSAAGFSPYWLQKVLKQQLGFKGAIFSDDLSMEGAGIAGDHLSRGQQALAAGVDLLLPCNDRAGAISLLDGLPIPDVSNPALDFLLEGQKIPVYGKERRQLEKSAAWMSSHQLATRLFAMSQ